MNTPSIKLTENNFLKLVDIKDLSANESEHLVNYGFPIFERMDDHHILFILENIFYCESCEVNHMSLNMIHFLGYTIEFTIEVRTIDCYAESSFYEHEGEILAMWSCGHFSYDPISKHLELWAT